MSGIEDEVVPRDHMQALWEIVLRRGQSAEEKEKERGKDTERERGEDKEGDPDKLPKWMTETSGGDKQRNLGRTVGEPRLERSCHGAPMVSPHYR